MESQIKNFSSSASAIYMLKHRFITMRRITDQLQKLVELLKNYPSVDLFLGA